MSAAGIDRHVRADQFLEEPKDLARFGMTSERLLREQQVPIDAELKDALAAGHKGEAGDHVLVVTEDVVRHPGGACPVVSRHAVFEGNRVLVHHVSFDARSVAGY